MSKLKAEKPAKKPADASGDDAEQKAADGGWRETVESVAMAVVLALLFRGFVAEAFVIPTGSMAPTLQGRHKDVACPQCGIWYQTSASEERTSTGIPTGEHAVSTTCPVCHYTQNLQLFDKPNDHSFSGDRIIVGKFCYDFAEPERWDVIVFKFPGDAVDNYIKRLIGLPGETIRIVGGNIYAGPSAAEASIVRKPPHKLNALLQIVDDTKYIPPSLVEVGWPSRWQEFPAGGKQTWTIAEGGREFHCSGDHSQDAWLRYRHLVPSYHDWSLVLEKQLPSGVAQRPGQLIPDYYAYNTARYIDELVPQGGKYSSYLRPGRYDEQRYDPEEQGLGMRPKAESLGQNWVDDLAVEAEVQIGSAQGELLLMVVRGGAKYSCRIDVASGRATLSAVDHDGAALEFDGPPGKPPVARPTANTRLKGTGSHRVKFANCDHELVLWIDGAVVQFDSPTTYPDDALIEPVYTNEDPGDLAPVGIGSSGLALKVTRLKLFRDKYYIAGAGGTDFVRVPYAGDGPLDEAERIHAIFAEPDLWRSTSLFAVDNRDSLQFELGDDQFLPLGDNSPASYDGRYWGTDPRDGRFQGPHQFVERELLIGKALLIYWPHTWNRPIPFWPNFRKMGPIR